MIRIAILGAGTPDAAEIIRILVNHPDAEIVAAVEPEFSGRKVADVHHGLTGDTDIEFVSGFDQAEADQVFICRNSSLADELRRLPDDEDAPRIVDMASRLSLCAEDAGFVPGIPELYRKPLVRGARRGLILDPAVTVSMIILGPLAMNMILSGEIEISIYLPQSMTSSFKAQDFSEDINALISELQKSWSGSVRTILKSSEEVRGMKVEIRISSPVSKEEIFKIYDSVYDDHNFSFPSTKEAGYKDVVGTQKVIVNVSETDGKTELIAYADARLRGGAGDAVHVMNLLFALHEKTGLTLKVSSF